MNPYCTNTYFPSRHHRQSYEEEESAEKFGQQQSYAHQGSKDRHSGASFSSSHRYRKSSAEVAASDSSEGEEAIKKEKYKKQYGEKESKEEYSKEKGKFKTSKAEKQLDMNEAIESYADNEEVSLNYRECCMLVLSVEKGTQHFR